MAVLGPTFKFAAPGTIQMGLINGVLGALAGSLVVRIIRWPFPTRFRPRALDSADADLVMMAGVPRLASRCLALRGRGPRLVLRVLTAILEKNPNRQRMGNRDPTRANCRSDRDSRLESS